MSCVYTLETALLNLAIKVESRVGAPEGELWSLIPPFSVVWIVHTVHDFTGTPHLCQ